MSSPNNLLSRLEEDGFVVIDLLGESEVACLNQLCDQYLGVGGSDFISSSHILEKKDSDFINNELNRIVNPVFEKYFPGLQLLGGSLATKTKGHSNLLAHQDWTIVDEDHYRSYNLWIPLVDTNSQNGTLGLVRGSHKWIQNIRGQNIPNPFERFTEKFLKIGDEPSLKVGQAILYDHRLIHYSRPNTTTENRNTAIIGVKEKEAALRVSFRDEKNIQTYAVDEAAFYQFDTGQIKAANVKSGEELFVLHEFKWREIIKMYNRYLPSQFHQKAGQYNQFVKWIRKFIS